MIEISLLTVTRNRGDRLGLFLEAVDRLGIDGQKSEFVIVDNDSTDGTSRVLEEWSFGRPGITVLHERRPGSGWARNKGWPACKGEIISMVDDDCYAQEGFLDAWLDVFARNPKVGFAGGKIVLHDPSDDPIGIDEWPEIRRYPAYMYLHCGAVQGSNLAFRRQALNQAGGFDPRTGAGTPYGCEDIETAARVNWCGWEGMYDPRPTVHHHHRRRDGAGHEHALKMYAPGTGAYHAKALLTPRMRWKYLRPFLARIKNNRWETSRQELKAAWRWWLHSRRVGFEPVHS